MTQHADKSFTHSLNPTYQVKVNDIVKIEARVTEIKGGHLVVEPLNNAEVYLSDVSRYTELRAPLDAPVIKRPLRVGDKVRYNVVEGLNEGYYHGRLVAFDNGKWIIRDNTSQTTAKTLVERSEEDISFGV